MQLIDTKVTTTRPAETKTLAPQVDDSFDLGQLYLFDTGEKITAKANLPSQPLAPVATSLTNEILLERDSKLTFGQRLADRVAQAMGSWAFISTQAAIVGGWIVWNVIPGLPHFDPYPFIFLNLALSCQAAFAAPAIMMSQNRQSQQDRIAEAVDHEVNKKTDLGVEKILGRLDELQAEVKNLKFEQSETRLNQPLNRITRKAA